MTSWRVPHGYESTAHPIPMGPKRISVDNNGLSGVDNNILFVPKKTWGSHADVGRYIESAVFGITGGVKPSTAVKSAHGLIKSLKKIHTMRQLKNLKNLKIPAKYASVKLHMINNATKKLGTIKNKALDTRKAKSMYNYKPLNGSAPDQNQLLKLFISGVSKSTGPAKNFKKQINNYGTKKGIGAAESLQKFLGYKRKFYTQKRLYDKAFQKKNHSNLTGDASGTAAIQASKKKKRVGN